MATTALSLVAGLPGRPHQFSAKTPADYPAQGLLVREFDLWRQGYAGAVVNIVRAGTTDLCPVFSDIGLTQAAFNPHVLLTRRDDDGNEYGKFQTSLYVPYPYELDIQNIQQTGIQLLPITGLDGQDASFAEVKTTNTPRLRALRDRAADVIRMIDYGAVGTVRVTNTTALQAAISAASAQGGGIVMLPAGTIVINSITLPAKVILMGEGQEVTVLDSRVAETVIEFTGDGCGLARLMLDGVQVNDGAIGVFGKGINEVVFEDVLVKRFETGIWFRGGKEHSYDNLKVQNCAYNIRLLGDQDVNGDNDGEEFSGLDWQNGSVETSTTVGLEFSVVDKSVRRNKVYGVEFLNNTGDDSALLIYGATFNAFENCTFEGNETHFKLQDNDDNSLAVLHEVIGLTFTQCHFDDGVCIFDGLAENVIMDRCEFEGTDLSANVPTNCILLRDCTEIDASISGDSTKIIRFTSTSIGEVVGTTTDGTTTLVYKTEVANNAAIILTVYAAAEKLNAASISAAFIYAQAFQRAPAYISYDAQTANFTAGKTIQGQTSGATAIIAADSDSGTTGTLSLAELNGVFLDNEIIAETDGSGSARANGTLTYGAVTATGAKADLLSVGTDTGAPPAGWDITFSGSGSEAQVFITGAAAEIVRWKVRVDVTAI